MPDVVVRLAAVCWRPRRSRRVLAALASAARICRILASGRRTVADKCGTRSALGIADAAEQWMAVLAMDSTITCSRRASTRGVVSRLATP